jgi:DNA-binding NarL/FixJ family response regulator
MPKLPFRPVRVLCVDDSRDISSVLGRCISREPDMESAGSLDCADEMLATVAASRPDVVLVDMNMPGKDPLEAIRELADARLLDREPVAGAEPSRPVRVIVFCGRDDDEIVQSAAKAGASGFLSKDAGLPVILEAIRAVARADQPFGVWR